MKKLDLHLAALASAGVGVGFVAERAPAAVEYSGIRNLIVPATLDGLYLNVVTGNTGSHGSSTPGWDINPWMTSSGWAIYAVGSTGTGGVMGGSLPPHGAVIGANSTWLTADSTPIPTGNDVIMGIRMFNESTGHIHYGWVAFNTSVVPMTIIDWALESVSGVSIIAGQGGRIFPSPSAATVLMLAAAPASLTRRRRAG